MGAFVADARQGCRTARGIDEDDIARRQCLQSCFERVPGRRIGSIRIGFARRVDPQMLRQRNRRVGFTIAFAVGEIARQRSLARIQVERSHAIAPIEGGNRQMQCGGGFAGAAFFVADDDDPLARLRYADKSDVGLKCHSYDSGCSGSAILREG